MAKVGRKGKYNPERVAALCRYIQMGLSNLAACNQCNINQDTYYQWLKVHPEFADAIKQAQERAEAVNLSFIHEARKKSWVAAAWLLERRFPEKYSLIRRHELSGPGGRPVPVAAATVDLTKVMSLDQLEKLAMVLDHIEKEADESISDQPAV